MNKMTFLQAINRSFWVVLCLTTAYLPQAQAAAGRVQFVAGEVKVQNAANKERTAQKGENIEAGDTIITGANSSMQVSLADGGMLAVRPNTQLRIDDYVYSGKADDKNNKSVFTLAKGTFRSITGAIGQNNREGYRVNTPGATMGIRGTDHEPAVFLPPPPGFPLPPGAPPPGTYDRVNRGQTFMQTAAGLILINPNQVGFAPAGGGAPGILPNVPGFYNNATKPGAANKAASGGGSTSSSSSQGGGTSSSSSSSSSSSTSTSSTSTSSTTSSSTTDSTITSGGSSSTTTTSSTNVSTNTTITTNTMISSVTGTSSATQTPAPPPLVPGAVGASIPIIPSIDGSGSFAVNDPYAQALFTGPSNELVYIFDGLKTPVFEVIPHFPPDGLFDVGTYTFPNGSAIYWGRYDPGTYATYRDFVDVTNPFSPFHYIYSFETTPVDLVTGVGPGAFTGTVNYTWLPLMGTRPTDAFGTPGDITAASLMVNFSGQSVTLNISTNIAGVSLSGSASGGIADFVNAPTAMGSGIVTPAMTMSPTILRAAGQFVGHDAGGAIVGFDLQNSAGDRAIGTAVFQK